MHVEVSIPAGPRRDRGLLPATGHRATVGGAGRTGRAAAQGARRPGTAAADVPGRLPSRRRGLRLRPQRRLRPDPAHDQPPPEVLHEAGLLDRDKRGVWVYYRARTQALASLAALIGSPSS